MNEFEEALSKLDEVLEKAGMSEIQALQDLHAHHKAGLNKAKSLKRKAKHPKIKAVAHKLVGVYTQHIGEIEDAKEEATEDAATEGAEQASGQS